MTLNYDALAEDHVRKFPLTDAGQAEFLVHLYSDQLRYNHTKGKWLIWNRSYWQNDVKSEVTGYALSAARERLKVATHISDSRDHEEVAECALKHEAEYKLRAVLKIAQTIDPIASVEGQWDTHRNLLQFENGVFDLDAGKLLSCSPELMLSKSTGISYDSTADCPRWNKFLHEIMLDRSELIEFIQRAVGYSITGYTSEQKFFILHGSGANGKSVFLNIVKAILGKYALDSRFSAFERKRGNDNTNDLARLQAARFVAASENVSSRQLDEERLKSITGDDEITARYLNQEFFTYRPTFKLWLAVNTLPEVRDFSAAIWRRVLLVPFDAKFRGSDCDPQLTDTLRSELPGIINWALAGLEQWKAQRLNPPAIVLQATDEYQRESDVVAKFLHDRVLISCNPNDYVLSADLYTAFLEWCEKEKPVETVTHNKFSRRVTGISDLKLDKRGGDKIFRGGTLITVKTEDVTGNHPPDNALIYKELCKN